MYMHISDGSIVIHTLYQLQHDLQKGGAEHPAMQLTGMVTCKSVGQNIQQCNCQA